MPTPPRGVKSWVGSRSLGDLLILMVTTTICLAVLLAGGGVALLALTQPDRDLAAVFSAIAAVLNTLLGLVAGYLAGRTDKRSRRDGDE